MKSFDRRFFSLLPVLSLMLLLCLFVLSCSVQKPETADVSTPEKVTAAEPSENTDRPSENTEEYTERTDMSSESAVESSDSSAETSEGPISSTETESATDKTSSDEASPETSTSSESSSAETTDKTEETSSETVPSSEDPSSETSSSPSESSPETTVPSTTSPSGETSADPGTPIPTCPELPYLKDLVIPEWSGTPYTALNNNIPFFKTEGLEPRSYELYYALDDLGRCTLADAVVGRDLQPVEKRGDISMIRPTGWHTDKYSFVNGQNLYNRCHLIAYYLTAENANERNLVTGTRYMNEDGMNSFENLVGDYVKETGNHVRYRVTPVFTGENLICDGLIVEAWSIEDEGDDICFCVFCYNLQPGIHIDYLTGDNYAENGEETLSPQTTQADLPTTEEDVIGDYVLNTNSHRFHLPSCEGAVKMSKKNREDYSGSRNALILDGYKPCSQCNP